VYNAGLERNINSKCDICFAYSKEICTYKYERSRLPTSQSGPAPHPPAVPYKATDAPYQRVRRQGVALNKQCHYKLRV